MLEQEVERLRFGQRRGGPLAQHAALDGGTAHALGVDAAAVVGDGEEHGSADGLGAQGEHRLRVLAAALRRRLDAVVDGVAHDVQQRLPQGIEHVALDLRAGGVDHAAQPLALPDRKLARVADEVAERGLDRLQLQRPAGAGHAVELHAAAIEVLDERAAVAAGEVGGGGAEAGDERAEIERELGDLLAQLVDLARRDLGPAILGCARAGRRRRCRRGPRALARRGYRLARRLARRRRLGDGTRRSDVLRRSERRLQLGQRRLRLRLGPQLVAQEARHRVEAAITRATPPPGTRRRGTPRASRPRARPR